MAVSYQVAHEDHPRGCGEHTASPVDISSPEGSSPRMRGARHYRRHHLACAWIIPADAGSTASHKFPNRSSKDHPRGCGEHFGELVAGDWPVGSSPRMRGAPQQVHELVHMPGIIPADAGSTKYVPLHCHTDKDHPRGCGEHQIQWGRNRLY